MELTFLYDVVCPYAWMASVQVEALARRTGANLRWFPVLLGGIFKEIGSAAVPASTWSASKVALGEKDLLRQAERLGLPIAKPDAHPRRTVDAMRLCVAASDEVRPALTADLYRAYWVDGLDVADRQVLATIARRHGLDPAVMNDPAVKQALADNTAFAVSRGAFGVPTFLVGDRLIWGNDRLHRVEAALGGTPRPAVPPVAPNPRGTPPALRFYHDFSSPFSYLASTVVERVAASRGATLEWTPILLGGLFRLIGTPDVPLFAMSEPRRRWFLQDMKESAEERGVPFRFPSTFPVRTVLPLRVSLLEPAATPLLYRALWADDLDIGQAEVLRAVLGEAGFDAAGLIAAAEGEDVKARLRANTEEAAARGVCGVPSFLVDGAYLFWGQDRLDQVEAALDGWRPASG